jgi:hypothetical protein
VRLIYKLHIFDRRTEEKREVLKIDIHHGRTFPMSKTQISKRASESRSSFEKDFSLSNSMIIGIHRIFDQFEEQKNHESGRSVVVPVQNETTEGRKRLSKGR